MTQTGAQVKVISSKHNEKGNLSKKKTKLLEGRNNCSFPSIPRSIIYSAQVICSSEDLHVDQS